MLDDPVLLFTSLAIIASGTKLTSTMDFFSANLTASERTLLKYCQNKGYQKPVYKVENRGTAQLDNVFRDKHYTVSVSVNSTKLAIADGMSKRNARMKCATLGMQRLRVLELHQLVTGYQRAMPELTNDISGSSMAITSSSGTDQPQITAAISQLFTPQIVELEPDNRQQHHTTPDRRNSTSTAELICNTLEHICHDCLSDCQPERHQHTTHEKASRDRKCHTNEDLGEVITDLQTLLVHAVANNETIDDKALRLAAGK